MKIQSPDAARGRGPSARTSVLPLPRGIEAGPVAFDPALLQHALVGGQQGRIDRPRADHVTSEDVFGAARARLQAAREG